MTIRFAEIDEMGEIPPIEDDMDFIEWICLEEGEKE